jgi:hypothetical protein
MVSDDGVKYYISAYRRALRELSRFMKMSFTDQYATFVPTAQLLVDYGCNGLISEMVRELKIVGVKNSDIRKLYTIAVFMHPDSIRAMLPELINEEIADIATKARGSLLEYVPVPLRTTAMYSRRDNCERMIEDTIQSIKNSMKELDFVAIFKRTGAERPFAVESEFIVDCETDFILKYINDVLHRCDPLVITSPLWYVMEGDVSAPNMYEIKTAPIVSSKELATLFCITLCLGKLEALEYIRIIDGCGTHVHVDATDETYSDVRKIEDAYLDNITVINRLIKASRIFNNYCLPSACTKRLKEAQLLELPHEALRKMKYHVVNTLAKFYNGTTEFRQYEGTTDVISLFAWIEFIHKFRKNAGIVGHCITAEALFDRVGLSKRARSFFTNKFMDNHRLF